MAKAKLEGVNVISKANLFEAARAAKNPQLLETVKRWHELITKNHFDSFMNVREVFPTSDLVGNKLIFNLGSYRLICGLSFLRKALFFKALLSHADYDQGGWK